MSMIHPNDRAPYIAVFGFRMRADVDAVLRDLPKASRHIFGLGLVVSPTSLASSSSTDIHATVPEVRAIAGSAPHEARLLYLLRYVAPLALKNRAGIGMQIVQARKEIGAGIQGVQLAASSDPISVQELATFHRYTTDEAKPIRFVLEVRPSAITAAGSTQRLLGTHIHYKVISDIMLAFDGPVDVDQARTLLTDLRSNFGRQVGYGVSGQLDPDTVGDLASLAKDFPELSLEMTAPATGIVPDEVLSFFVASIALF